MKTWKFDLSTTLLLTIALSIGACAHHRDVRPGPDGVHRVQIQTDDVDAANRDAISQANNYCKSKSSKSEAVFLNEGSKYTGSMAEGDYKTAKTLSKAAQAIGGSMAVLGGQDDTRDAKKCLERR